MKNGRGVTLMDSHSTHQGSGHKVTQEVPPLYNASGPNPYTLASRKVHPHPPL